jgi:signal-transduction protein with cAMP-binding, CBS, and nucleotidyltransferase domain|tara:strand:+ start:67 stop:495 length:429 start_codon:yes stop_codon:yes gene_type:complete
MPGKLVSRMSKRERYTLQDTDTVKIASQKLHEKKVGCMPVMDKNKNVAGIISEKDLSQLIYTERFNLNLPVSKLMTKKLVTCDLNTSVTELMDEMTEKKIRHILIMEDKKLLGIVSIGDVVNHLIDKIKDENKSLKEYINSY